MRESEKEEERRRTSPRFSLRHVRLLFQGGITLVVAARRGRSFVSKLYSRGYAQSRFPVFETARTSRIYPPHCLYLCKGRERQVYRYIYFCRRRQDSYIYISMQPARSRLLLRAVCQILAALLTFYFPRFLSRRWNDALSLSLCYNFCHTLACHIFEKLYYFGLWILNFFFILYTASLMRDKQWI